MKQLMKKLMALGLCALLISTLAAPALAVTASESSDGRNTEKVIFYYKKKKISTAKTYAKKLNKYAKEACVSKMSSGMKKAYRAKIKRYTIYDYDGNKYLWDYYLTDFNNDGKANLLLIRGTCEADVRCYVYKYSSGKVVSMGSFYCSNYDFCAYPKHNGILYWYGHMGGESLYLVKSVSGKIKKETIGSRYTDGPYFPSRCMLKGHLKWDKNYTRHMDLSVFNLTKKAVYSAGLTGATNNVGEVYKVYVSNGKLAVKGSLIKASNEEEMWNGFNQALTVKTRYFTLASTVKYYAVGGTAAAESLSQKEFLELASLNNGLGLYLYVNSKGQVYKAVISS